MSRFREFMKGQQNEKFGMGSFGIGVNSGFLFVMIVDNGPLWAACAHLALIILGVKLLRLSK